MYQLSLHQHWRFLHVLSYILCFIISIFFKVTSGSSAIFKETFYCGENGLFFSRVHPVAECQIMPPSLCYHPLLHSSYSSFLYLISSFFPKLSCQIPITIQCFCFQWTSFVEERNDAEGQISYIGFSIEILKMAAGRMNFTWVREWGSL